MQWLGSQGVGMGLVGDICFSLKIISSFYTPSHVSGEVLFFHIGHSYVCPSVSLSVCSTSVRPSALHFRSITSVFINGFHSNCAHKFIPTLEIVNGQILIIYHRVMKLVNARKMFLPPIPFLVVVS